MGRNTLSRSVLRRNFANRPGCKSDLFRRQTDLSGRHSDLNRRSSSLFRHSSSLLGRSSSLFRRSSSLLGRSSSPSCGETSLLRDDSSPNDRHSSLSHPETSPSGDGPVGWPGLERFAKPRAFVQSDSSPGHPAALTVGDETIRSDTLPNDQAQQRRGTGEP